MAVQTKKYTELSVSKTCKVARLEQKFVEINGILYTHQQIIDMKNALHDLTRNSMLFEKYAYEYVSMLKSTVMQMFAMYFVTFAFLLVALYT